MNRVQWYKITPFDRKALKTLSEKLLKMPYGRANRAGFNVENIRVDVIAGKFIERVEFTEVIVDPLGTEVKVERVRFDTTEFSIFADINLIECINPGRNLKNFLNEIAKCTNYEVAISKVQIPLQEFSAALKIGAKFIAVTKAVADDIELADGVLGQLQVVGAADIRKPLQQFLGGRKYELSRIRIIIDALEERFIIEATRAGTVSSTTAIDQKLRQLLRKNVASLIEPGE
jgi:hypothetical protein